MISGRRIQLNNYLRSIVILFYHLYLAFSLHKCFSTKFWMLPSLSRSYNKSLLPGNDDTGSTWSEYKKLDRYNYPMPQQSTDGKDLITDCRFHVEVFADGWTIIQSVQGYASLVRQALQKLWTLKTVIPCKWVDIQIPHMHYAETISQVIHNILLLFPQYISFWIFQTLWTF